MKVLNTRNCNLYLHFSKKIVDIQFIIRGSVQFRLVAQSCPTLCNPMNRSTPGLPVDHQLPEFTQTYVHRVRDAIQPSHPLSSPSPPAPNPSQHHSLLQWVNSSHEVAKVLEFQLYHHCFQRNPWFAAAKSPQTCPTLCDPRDSSPPGSPVPGILQARTLEWVAISLSNAWTWKVKVKSLSCVWLLATPWTAAYQAPPSMGSSRQEYWSGVYDLLNPFLFYWFIIFHSETTSKCLSIPSFILYSLLWRKLPIAALAFLNFFIFFPLLLPTVPSSLPSRLSCFSL